MAYTDQFAAEQIKEILKNGAVGIDLGTTYSAVAAISDVGTVEVLSNSEGDLTTPSVVLFDEDGTTIVGEQAKQTGQGQADRVVECAKRAMCTPGFEYDIAGQKYTPIGISTLILNKLAKDASERLGRDVKSAVITVPAWFNDDARQATRKAGELAGLTVLGILSEPSAAALAYGISGQTGKTVLVYDLGGGTFDVSVVRIAEDGDIDELARDGDVKLGGKDWDVSVIEQCREAFTGEHDAELPKGSDAYMTLSVDAEKAKQRLSQAEQSRVFVNHDGNKTTLKFTREDFEDWTAAHLARTEETVRIVLEQAGVTAEQIDVVLPVGGSTKMPQVKELLESLFPGKVDHSVEKDHVVAIGACLYMAKKIMTIHNEVPDENKPHEGEDGTRVVMLPGGIKTQLENTTIIQRSSRTYGIVVYDDDNQSYNDHFIRANEKLPLDVEKAYCTLEDNQEVVRMQLLEGDSRVVEDCVQLAEQSCPLPPGLPRRSPLQTKFIFTEEGEIRIECTPQGGQTTVMEHAGATVSSDEEAAVAGAIRTMEV